MSSQSIPIYVRIGSTRNSRLISFDAPPRLSQKDSLAMGFAIDGEALLFEVSPGEFSVDGDQSYTIYGCLHDGSKQDRKHDHGDLVGALRCTQLTLMSFLEEHDYDVTFE